MRDRAVELVNVTAVIVTRGDVDLEPVLDSLPPSWERVVWNNGGSIVRSAGERVVVRSDAGDRYVVLDSSDFWAPVPDLAVYGRYAAIEHATSDLIYVQDDDVIVSDPQAIVDAWEPGHVVCNMPQEFRPHYPDSALVGFGACFERDLPDAAFRRYSQHHHYDAYLTGSAWPPIRLATTGPQFLVAEFARECDTVLTTLTPRILVDVPKTDREFASDPDRLWKQPEHGAHRARMLELARQVRDS